ncbi:MAG TPA: sensor histidine kinase [Sphingobium sp.]|nr:sensor histidine kinase [Sphingobium sp.]
MLHQPILTVDPVVDNNHDDRLRMILDEARHRSRNMFAIVLVVATQTLIEAENLDQAREALTARLQALARSHELLHDDQWMNADVAGIFDRTVCQHLGVPPARLLAYGPALHLQPRAAQSLSMAFHELATNALKYGALSNANGIVSVRWWGQDTDSGGIRFEWREHGGPPVREPTRSGFGSDLIHTCLAAAAGGRPHARFSPDGVIWTVGA